MILITDTDIDLAPYNHTRTHLRINPHPLKTKRNFNHPLLSHSTPSPLPSSSYRLPLHQQDLSKSSYKQVKFLSFAPKTERSSVSNGKRNIKLLFEHRSKKLKRSTMLQPLTTRQSVAQRLITQDRPHNVNILIKQHKMRNKSLMDNRGLVQERQMLVKRQSLMEPRQKSPSFQYLEIKEYYECKYENSKAKGIKPQTFFNV